MVSWLLLRGNWLSTSTLGYHGDLFTFNMGTIYVPCCPSKEKQV
jgi:hypothetical protein